MMSRFFEVNIDRDAQEDCGHTGRQCELRAKAAVSQATSGRPWVSPPGRRQGKLDNGGTGSDSSEGGLQADEPVGYRYLCRKDTLVKEKTQGADLPHQKSIRNRAVASCKVLYQIWR